jgi:acyl-CoA dehydrogenase
MAWDFETETDYQRELDWVDDFVREQVEPLDLVFGSQYDKSDERAMSVVRPLQAQVRARGLWACHLDPEHGGQGYGQLRLALLNEILGRSRWAPTVFGCQAPDSGNAEILAAYGTELQKDLWLAPLLDGEISSCYAMTEPHAGADPALFTTTARRDGDGWVLNGEKWFASNARFASVFLVLAITDPEVDVHEGMSMFILPAGTPGLEIVRNVGIGQEPVELGTHAYLRLHDVRLPGDGLIGSEGLGFAVAQTRLSGGRVHHAMRTVAQARMAFDWLCERAVSRTTRRGTLGDLQLTRERIADSWIELEQFRLLVLRTAWLIDKHAKVRKEIAAVKIAMPRVLHEITRRAMHLHGSIGLSNEMPFWDLMVQAEVLGMADGPTEVHQMTLARDLLKGYVRRSGDLPSAHLPTRREAARAASPR